MQWPEKEAAGRQQHKAEQGKLKQKRKSRRVSSTHADLAKQTQRRTEAANQSLTPQPTLATSASTSRKMQGREPETAARRVGPVGGGSTGTAPVERPLAVSPSLSGDPPPPSGLQPPIHGSGKAGGSPEVFVGWFSSWRAESSGKDEGVSSLVTSSGSRASSTKRRGGRERARRQREPAASARGPHRDRNTHRFTRSHPPRRSRTVGSWKLGLIVRETDGFE